MDVRDFYYLQKVTEAELNGAFTAAQQADWNQAIDQDLTGIAAGMTASQAASPDLTVDVSGPGTAYDSLGRRIYFGSAQNADVSVDESSVSTAVASSGNEKYVSVFVEFDRTLTDARIDGNGVGLFFQQDESFKFVIQQGSEAAAGSATPVPLDPNMVLVCDILRTYGQTTILDTDLDTSRRQDAISLTTGTLQIIAGTPAAAISDLLTDLNAHVDATATRHAAADIDYAGSGTWAGANGSLAAETVEAALDQIVSDLASSANPSGADRIGTRDTTATWADATTLGTANVRDALNAIVTALGSTATGSKIRVGAVSNWLGGRTNPATDLFSAIDKIIADLAATAASDDGAERIGAEAHGNLVVGSVRSQLNALEDAKAEIAIANTFSAVNTFTVKQSFNQALDATPLLESISTPTLTYKLIWQILLTGGVYLRIYAVSAGGFAVSVNAQWNSPSWVADITTAAAALYEMDSSGILTIGHEAAGPASWTTWATSMTLDGTTGAIAGPGTAYGYAAWEGNQAASGNIASGTTFSKTFPSTPSSITFVTPSTSNTTGSMASFVSRTTGTGAYITANGTGTSYFYTQVQAS